MSKNKSENTAKKFSAVRVVDALLGNVVRQIERYDLSPARSEIKKLLKSDMLSSHDFEEIARIAMRAAFEAHALESMQEFADDVSYELENGDDVIDDYLRDGGGKGKCKGKGRGPARGKGGR